ncbi:alpha/beta hydrolase [bacterium]|nr:alpha/beta hydrolase [bacterium]
MNANHVAIEPTLKQRLRIQACLACLIPLLSITLFASQPPPPPAGWTEHYVMANDIRIHYWRTGGNKPVMIMLHGSSDNGLCMTLFAKEFTADYDIILPDARGHGLSDPPAKGESADAQAEDIAGLIKALNLEKPIVMGHSMGSSSAAWFAAKYPDVPKAIILEDPRLVSRPQSKANASDVTKAQNKRAAGILAKNNMTYGKILNDQLKRNSKWEREEIAIWATSKIQHHPLTSYGNRSNRPAMSELFSRITAPTLILKADDKGENRRKNIEVTRILKHGKIVHIDGAGHNVRRENKSLTVRTLKDFLSTL